MYKLVICTLMGLVIWFIVSVFVFESGFPELFEKFDDDIIGMNFHETENRFEGFDKREIPVNGKNVFGVLYIDVENQTRFQVIFFQGRVVIMERFKVFSKWESKEAHKYYTRLRLSAFLTLKYVSVFEKGGYEAYIFQKERVKYRIVKIEDDGFMISTSLSDMDVINESDFPREHYYLSYF